MPDVHAITHRLKLSGEFPGRGWPLFGRPIALNPGDLLYAEGDYLCGVARLLDHLSGFRASGPGTVMLDGRDVSRETPDQRHLRGLIYASGRKRVLGSLTLAEHLQLRSLALPRRIRVADALAEARSLFPVLADLPDVPCGNYSGGQQQMVMLAVAAVCEPGLLVLDEPGLGLAPEVRPLVAGLCRALRASGTTLVITEQRSSGLKDEATTRWRYREGGIPENY